MNTFLVTYALEQDTITKRKFCGVFIANTDPSTEPGTHWVGFYFSTELKAEFFESYGYPPDH